MIDMYPSPEANIAIQGEAVEFDDKPREACGVAAAITFNGNAVQLTHGMLEELQHRGQEATGMTAADELGRLCTYKALGLVKDVYEDGSNLSAKLPIGANTAIGHVRWGTMAHVSDKLRVAQPLGDQEKTFAIAHNGHIPNIDEVMADRGFLPGAYASDSEALMLLVEQQMVLSGDKDLANALRAVIPTLKGAISLTATDGNRIIGLRDGNGFRPLSLGRLADGSGYAFVSETPALSKIGANFEREVGAGEMVIIDEFGVTAEQLTPAEEALCLYEYVYFSNKKNVFGGQVVGDVRRRLGAELAHEQPAPAGAIVLGVPNSGLPASEGYADALGLEKVNAIEKNKNAIRTFIIPTQAAREEAAMQKYIIDEEAVADKIVVVVDDSLIRSTTARALSKQLRGAGALEVHFRIPAPPYRYSCTYGMDTGDASELLAAKMSVDDMPAELGVDSVAFLSVEAAYRASVRSVGQMCTACCTGIYPTPVPVGIRQQALART